MKASFVNFCLDQWRSSEWRHRVVTNKLRFHRGRLKVGKFCDLTSMLWVGESHFVFASSSALSDIFYDDVNKKIVTVHNKDGGEVDVRSYGLVPHQITPFRLKDKGRMRIIKFSPDERLLCVQYDDFSVDFINVASRNDCLLSAHFSHSPRNRSARIIGIEWILANQILLITNQAGICL
ncbi:unnamed protein product [Gongylonema pulchrum]|uniref:WD_REPEATS_REGION domain-containing protein n=1 Tax=Gongylonema pulchrum TaxID=637853 RepID=A0A183DTR0_9BILA|nr:unnamed protein product [Gongylonema pulchrum]